MERQDDGSSQRSITVHVRTDERLAHFARRAHGLHDAAAMRRRPGRRGAARCGSCHRAAAVSESGEFDQWQQAAEATAADRGLVFLQGRQQPQLDAVYQRIKPSAQAVLLGLERLNSAEGGIQFLAPCRAAPPSIDREHAAWKA